MKQEKILKIGFVGDPVHHSSLPDVYQLIADQINRNIQFDAYKTSADQFVDVIHDLARNNYLAVCITVPHKFLAYEIATDFTQRAKLAGSVNFLLFKSQNRIYADNTDGHGFIADLINHDISLTDKSVLILGTGGAARGIIHPVINCSPKSIDVCGRTANVLKKFKEKFIVEIPKNIFFYLYQDLIPKKYDMIINCTSASIFDEDLFLNPYLIDQHTICYDLAYRSEETKFQKYALDAGADCALNGTGMLIEQAVEIIKNWTDQVIDTKPILASLQERLIGKSEPSHV